MESPQRLGYTLKRVSNLETREAEIIDIHFLGLRNKCLPLRMMALRRVGLTLSAEVCVLCWGRKSKQVVSSLKLGCCQYVKLHRIGLSCGIALTTKSDGKGTDRTYQSEVLITTDFLAFKYVLNVRDKSAHAYMPAG